jgi:hypothetical protein
LPSLLQPVLQFLVLQTPASSAVLCPPYSSQSCSSLSSLIQPVLQLLPTPASRAVPCPPYSRQSCSSLSSLLQAVRQFLVLPTPSSPATSPYSSQSGNFFSLLQPVLSSLLQPVLQLLLPTPASPATSPYSSQSCLAVMGPGGQLLTRTLTLQFFPIKSNKMSYK